MPSRLTVEQYFRRPETLQPNELVFGVVREPAAPRYDHQSIVTRATMLLGLHVRSRGLGEVCVSPVDVVLDRARALVLQPDLVFISAARLEIIHDRVWGAPDLVVEVLSRRTAGRDRGVKLAWYQRYGVQECWLIDPITRRIEIVDCTARGSQRRRTYRGDEAVRSRVLPALDVRVREFFE